MKNWRKFDLLPKPGNLLESIIIHMKEFIVIDESVNQILPAWLLVCDNMYEREKSYELCDQP